MTVLRAKVHLFVPLPTPIAPKAKVCLLVPLLTPNLPRAKVLVIIAAKAIILKTKGWAVKRLKKIIQNILSSTGKQ